MSSTPLTWFSISWVTLSSTTCALAPGNEVVTLTVGGVMSGVLSTGRIGIESPPRITITIEITSAKTGRWMKKRLKPPTST